jgi:hypothetical protein
VPVQSRRAPVPDHYGFAFHSIRAVLLNLYLLRLDYDAEFIGLVNGATALVFTLFCLPAGALGTRWGSRRIMIVGVNSVAMGGGLLPLVEWRPSGDRKSVASTPRRKSAPDFRQSPPLAQAQQRGQRLPGRFGQVKGVPLGDLVSRKKLPRAKPIQNKPHDLSRVKPNLAPGIELRATA